MFNKNNNIPPFFLFVYRWRILLRIILSSHLPLFGYSCYEGICRKIFIHAEIFRSYRWKRGVEVTSRKKINRWHRRVWVKTGYADVMKRHEPCNIRLLPASENPHDFPGNLRDQYLTYLEYTNLLFQYSSIFDLIQTILNYSSWQEYSHNGEMTWLDYSLKNPWTQNKQGN